MASSSQTAECDQTAISDITDVSWALRKTSLIEGGARKVIEDAKILLDNTDLSAKKRKLGNQKKETAKKSRWNVRSTFGSRIDRFRSTRMSDQV